MRLTIFNLFSRSHAKAVNSHDQVVLRSEHKIKTLPNAALFKLVAVAYSLRFEAFINKHLCFETKSQSKASSHGCDCVCGR